MIRDGILNLLGVSVDLGAENAKTVARPKIFRCV